VVGALLIVNAVVSFAQERRAAGVVEALRRRVQVCARVLREAYWQVIPARELVPGDIVRVRPGDIIPADIKLLTGAARRTVICASESRIGEREPRTMRTPDTVPIHLPIKGGSCALRFPCHSSERWNPEA
jgi:magnesium-transporting ATPase (P-type)